MHFGFDLKIHIFMVKINPCVISHYVNVNRDWDPSIQIWFAGDYFWTACNSGKCVEIIFLFRWNDSVNVLVDNGVWCNYYKHWFVCHLYRYNRIKKNYFNILAVYKAQR